ncbi:ParB family chromosome partitioning protein [Aminobacter niigataensis]|uniref:ParB family chromosome partitioning protein n=1 Tax=Aminobacter niigataensis TaxID=83265 RepID=A0ABR6L924_9HYPH|nr:plasmid partitioning protein RepB [Aminobacter niigataensis]MBB4653300.1 ParB family chromosome partitioning protein [Aminobacter niigataensis]
MARKHLLASVTASLNADNGELTHLASEARSEYAKRGASRSMIQSLDEMAENSLRMFGGETVVSLDPALLDGSFVADRIGEDDEEYKQLREAIRRSGQSTPILVRPHPDDAGRYMIVFGHRRAKVAKDLGFSVRAVIKPLADIEHVVAQGQENTARADLSFIEKALFARKLLDSGMTKDTVKSALTIDDTLLSRMSSVAETIPETVLDAVGAAKGVGRDRWEELKKIVQIPANAIKAVEVVGTEGFAAAQANDEAFNFLLNFLKSSKRSKKAKTAAKPNVWAPDDNLVCVSVNKTPKKAVIAVEAADGIRFADFITGQLDSLYEAFRQLEK